MDVDKTKCHFCDNIDTKQVCEECSYDMISKMEIITQYKLFYKEMSKLPEYIAPTLDIRYNNMDIVNFLKIKIETMKNSREKNKLVDIRNRIYNDNKNRTLSKNKRTIVKSLLNTAICQINRQYGQQYKQLCDDKIEKYMARLCARYINYTPGEIALYIYELIDDDIHKEESKKHQSAEKDIRIDKAREFKKYHNIRCYFDYIDGYIEFDEYKNNVDLLEKQNERHTLINKYLMELYPKQHFILCMMSDIFRQFIKSGDINKINDVLTKFDNLILENKIANCKCKGKNKN